MTSWPCLHCASPKLTLGHIYEGLGEMELDEAVEVGEDEGLATPCRRLVTAVITIWQG